MVYSSLADGRREGLEEKRDIDARVEEMDRNDIAMMILSPSPPGPEMIPDPAKAADLARRLNDHAAENLVAKYPDRLKAFAAVPLHDAEKGADELERAVRDLGFAGALINGFTNISATDEDEVQYLDEPQVEPFWDRVERLGVPVYLHPRPPTPATKRAFRSYQGLNGSVWGFHIDVILGHMGELLPFQRPRIDHRLRHMLFSVDTPWEIAEEFAPWFDTCPISDNDRQKIGRTNAGKLFGLKLPAVP